MFDAGALQAERDLVLVATAPRDGITGNTGSLPDSRRLWMQQGDRDPWARRSLLSGNKWHLLKLSQVPLFQDVETPRCVRYRRCWANLLQVHIMPSLCRCFPIIQSVSSCCFQSASPSLQRAHVRCRHSSHSSPLGSEGPLLAAIFSNVTSTHRACTDSSLLGCDDRPRRRAHGARRR